MNPTLEYLLAARYDALDPVHLDNLRASGLTDATIGAHFIRTVPRLAIRDLLGFGLPEGATALLFPFRSPEGGFLDHVFVKRFPSGQDAKGHTIKYLTRRGAPTRLYFTAPHLRAICQGDAPLWLVEGVKQSLAVAQEGLPAVGFMGVENWHPAGRPLELCEDFKAIPLKGRIVEVLPDGDYDTNPNVRLAVDRLGNALLFAGAKARRRILPQSLEPS
jgi:hypothetical protein